MLVPGVEVLVLVLAAALVEGMLLQIMVQPELPVLEELVETREQEQKMDPVEREERVPQAREEQQQLKERLIYQPSF